MSFFRLKDLIRAVRVCKTATDERNVIRRESAAIRTSFKEVESQDARFVNVQKLLYIYLLGFPVQFGQLECLKLAASPRFSDKRVGYLGVTLLLDEKQDILTLLTNSLKNDMNNADDYIVGLALTTLSCVASSEVANDLADEVERLLDSPRSYLRKKAALAAVRIVRREPDLADAFVGRVGALINDRHHGVKMGGLILLEELCNYSQEALEAGRKLVSVLARQLRGLATSEPSPEHSVRGINDPFMQISLMRLMRVVARGSQEASDELNDVLTLVATLDDTASNVGTAILYECAVTALAIPSDQPLRVLAINLLGKFLANTDNNARYVALATLSAAVITEAPSVQRHRDTVLQCMRDDDISIRRRAVDLSFALINAENVKHIVNEILRVLPHIDLEFRSSMVYRLSAAITLYADSHEWHVERMLRVLSLGGSYLNARDLHKFIRLIAAQVDEGLQRRATRISFALLDRDISQDKMVIAGVWLIGEYADLLVARSQQQQAADSKAVAAAKSPGLDEDDLDILGALGRPIKESAPSEPNVPAALDLDQDLPEAIPEPADVVRLLSSISRSPVISSPARRMTLTALAKVAGRFADQPSVLSSVRTALAHHTHSMDQEVQARAVEFEKLLSNELDTVRAAVVERMPLPEYAEVPYEEYVLNPTAMRMKALTVIKRPAIQPEDLIGDGSAGGSKAATTAAAAEANKQSVVSDLLNLMDEAPAAAPSSPPPQPQQQSRMDSIADLLSSTTLSPIPASSQATSPVSESAIINNDDLGKEYSVFNEHGLKITLTPTKKPSAPQVIDLLAKFTNIGESAISDVAFLVAVPKSQKIQIHPPSGQHISVGANITQLLRVSNPSKSAIRLRMKISFTEDGQKHESMFDYSGFPASIV
ncbi:clathrin associated protein complex large subunit [Coemansia brasiliensis]|uniref:AP-1 complex subunit gamma n=1 Tax=Coemansia brasiliensis TaxID=2650707 RepID=A0A9W8M1Y4_9FUNG|nr:clathrin associated protein complex large subunit [Coemansia brasiliensis]